MTLLTKLERYGFRGTFLALLKSYLQFRRQQVTITNFTSALKPIKAGVPQGSILGPLLFNLYINDVVNIDRDTKFIIYADDTSLFLTDRNIPNLITKANHLLNKLDEWSTANSLTINTTKTKAVLFRPRQQLTRYEFNLKLGSTVIEVVPVVKSLGVLFEEHMSWTNQVEAVLNKLAKLVGILCRLRFFLPQSIKQLLYKSLFLSKLSYCYLVWGTTTKTNITKLHKIQKKAVRIIANVPYDTHTEPIFRCLNLYPIHDFYNMTLLRRYEDGVKYNDAFLTQLSELTAKDNVRNLRVKERWKIPRTRTNYGQQMLSYQLPLLLNTAVIC